MMSKYKIHAIDDVCESTMADFLQTPVGIFARYVPGKEMDQYNEARSIVEDTPNVMIGHVERPRYHPDAILKIHRILNHGKEPTIVAEEVVSAIMSVIYDLEYFTHSPDYRFVDPTMGICVQEMLDFLNDNMGKKILPLHW